jgi:hypothetical protein
MDIATTLPTMLPHGRSEVLDWCREVDEGPWSSLAIPERTTYTSHDCIVQLSAAAALTRRLALWTTIVILPAHDAVDIAKKMASVDVLATAASPSAWASGVASTTIEPSTRASPGDGSAWMNRSRRCGVYGVARLRSTAPIL